MHIKLHRNENVNNIPPLQNKYCSYDMTKQTFGGNIMLIVKDEHDQVVYEFDFDPDDEQTKYLDILLQSRKISNKIILPKKEGIKYIFPKQKISPLPMNVIKHKIKYTNKEQTQKKKNKGKGKSKDIKKKSLYISSISNYFYIMLYKR